MLTRLAIKCVCCVAALTLSPVCRADLTYPRSYNVYVYLKVMDQSGNPVEGAMVRLSGTGRFTAWNRGRDVPGFTEGEFKNYSGIGGPRSLEGLSTGTKTTRGPDGKLRTEDTYSAKHKYQESFPINFKAEPHKGVLDEPSDIRVTATITKVGYHDEKVVWDLGQLPRSSDRDWTLKDEVVMRPDHTVVRVEPKQPTPRERASTDLKADVSTGEASAVQEPTETRRVLQNPRNGHYYSIEQERSSWYGAKEKAKLLRHAVLPGHLATINTRDEEEWICTELVLPVLEAFLPSPKSLSAQFWIGGYKSVRDWSWVTGELWTYPSFKSEEGIEYLLLVIMGGGKHSYVATEGSSGNTYYIVEYEPIPISAAERSVGVAVGGSATKTGDGRPGDGEQPRDDLSTGNGTDKDELDDGLSRHPVEQTGYRVRSGFDSGTLAVVACNILLASTLVVLLIRRHYRSGQDVLRLQDRR